MPSGPELRTPPSAELGVLLWRLPAATVALSSAAVGGGFTGPTWVMNIRVPSNYRRTDLAAHAAEVATDLGVDGPGVALFTAADLGHRTRGSGHGVTVDATVGISKPTWAADPSGGHSTAEPSPGEPSTGVPSLDEPSTDEPSTDGPDVNEPGTINLVAMLPVTLQPAAAVNAVMTMTEAKVQALADHGVCGTGTASDAVVICWPAGGAEIAAFAGPRSRWGAALAIATHTAVSEGIANR